MNADDGFDLFAKNRAIGSVIIEDCESYLNGYVVARDGAVFPTRGNGNGFKLGGSGIYAEHIVRKCIAEGNKRDGFTSNSNPYMNLEDCVSRNNGRKNISYGYYEGARTRNSCRIVHCDTSDNKDFDRNALEYSLQERFPQCAWIDRKAGKRK